MRVKQDENSKLLKLLIEAVKNQEVKEVGRLIDSGEYEISTEDSDGNSLLAIASGHSTGNLEMMDFLIGRNANINAQNRVGESVLTYACRKNGSPIIIKYLLEHKANIEQKDRDGMTPLMMAAREQKSEAAKLLISARANLEAATKRVGNTALLLACDKKNYGIVSLLIQAGVNVNHKQYSGDQCTALMIAASKLQDSVISILTLLLQAGADYTIEDRAGKTALSSRNDALNKTCCCFLNIVIPIYGLLFSPARNYHAMLCGSDWLEANFSSLSIAPNQELPESTDLNNTSDTTDKKRKKIPGAKISAQRLDPLWSFKPKRSFPVLREHAEKISRGIKLTLEAKASRANLNIPETKELLNFVEDQVGKYQQAIIAALLDWDLLNDFTDDTDRVTRKNQTDFIEKLTEKLLKLFYVQPLKFRSVEEITNHVKDILVEWGNGIMHQQSSAIPALLAERRRQWQQEINDIKSPIEVKDYKHSHPDTKMHSVEMTSIEIDSSVNGTKSFPDAKETKVSTPNLNSNSNLFPTNISSPTTLPVTISAPQGDTKRQEFTKNLAALAEIKDRKVLQQKFSELENRAIEFQSADFYIQRGEFYFAAAEVESNDLRLRVLYGKALQDFQSAITHDPFAEGIPEKIQKIMGAQKKLDAVASPRLYQPSPSTNETPLSDQEREAIEKMKAEMRKNMSMNREA